MTSYLHRSDLVDNAEGLRPATSWHCQVRRWLLLASWLLLVVKSAWDDDTPWEALTTLAPILLG